MTHGENRSLPDLINDTAVNVVGLLKGDVGDRRDFALHLDTFPMGDDLTASDLDGEIKLTKLRDRILVKGKVTADVEIECVRCLQPYAQPVETEFAEEFWQTVDVRTGVELTPTEAPRDEEDRFSISENHELDIGEALRQHLVLALPMRPDCGENCPGPYRVGSEGEEPVDDRLAALATLLDGSSGQD